MGVGGNFGLEEIEMCLWFWWLAIPRGFVLEIAIDGYHKVILESS